MFFVQLSSCPDIVVESLLTQAAGLGSPFQLSKEEPEIWRIACNPPNLGTMSDVQGIAVIAPLAGVPAPTDGVTRQTERLINARGTGE